MDPDLRKIIDERLAKGEIDFEEHRKLIDRLKESEPSSGYAVLLQACSPSKIETIKVVREATGCGLKEAKQLVEAAPVVIVEGLDRSAADAIARNLADIGARAEASPDNSGVVTAGRAAAAAARTQAASGCLLYVAAALLIALLLAGVLPAETAAFPR